jgi:poly-gamma-glutamate capsule biosynthesis protein CapA/YwtB (metallophosphatase superfamily)
LLKLFILIAFAEKEIMGEPRTNSSSSVRFAAIGDLLLTTPRGAVAPGRGLEALSDELRQLFASCDIVLANLECTLPGKEMVPTEPRVFTSEAQVLGLAEAGINTVSLANNHAFDGGNEGFKKLTDLLDRQKIAWFGAGLTLSDAGRPLILDIKGIRLAIIGAVDASSGMNQFSGPSQSGVPQLDEKSLCQQIKLLSGNIDQIILSPHWGHERFRFPSPEQIRSGHAFIDAGAAMVLGHHPHVVQGMEFYKECPIIYSLGNFIANHVYWDSGDFLTWNRFERTGCIILAELEKCRIKSVKRIPVFDDGRSISIDASGRGERYLRNANQMLAKGVTRNRYRRENFRVSLILPILSRLRWRAFNGS